MTKQIDMITYLRGGLLKLLDGLTLEQVNKVPEGFNNNLAWHLGHVIATQQGIAYVKSGQTPVLDMGVFEHYGHGTKPERDISQEEFDHLKQVAVTSLQQFSTDVERGLFTNFSGYTLSNGMELATVNDAIGMLLFHEGLHMGFAQALKRVVAA